MCGHGLPTGISKGEATVILIVNIFFPGVGTIVAGCLSSDGGCGTIMVGLLQIVLVPVFLVGWIWAICWSLRLRKAGESGGRGTGERGGGGAQVSPPPPVAS